MKYYTGIGSRKTPPQVLILMSKIASLMEEKGYILRSGGASGADQAFASGVRNENNMEVYLPWSNFEGQRGIVSGDDYVGRKIAEQFHPNWGALRQGGQKLMTRNSHQVLGRDCKTPSELVMCWTPGGTGSGGTGQALRIARHHGIKIYDLGAEEILNKVMKKIEDSGTR
jgi:hypothetical protein